jgi:hypothetical protein
MAVDDVYQLTFNCLSPTGLQMSSLHFIRTLEPEPLPSDFQAIANDFKAIHISVQGDTYSYSSWRARRIRGDDVTWPATGPCAPEGGVIIEGAFTAPLNGSSGTELLPPQSAMVTTIRTGVPGRTRRGRVYVGGFTEPTQAGGQWLAGILPGIVTAWQGFFTEYAVATPVSGFRLGVWSTSIANGRCTRNPDGTHTRLSIPNPDDAFRPATVNVTRTTVFTQRRRVLGHGV